jgi:outer membrane lipoprotein-sorting protein
MNANNNKLLAIAGVIIVLLLLAGGFFYLSSSSKKQAPVAQTTTQTAVPTSSSTQATIKSLLASATPKQCNYSDHTVTTTINGTIYVAGGKASADFQMESPKGPITSHMISDGTYVYVWTSTMTQGFKMPLSQATANAQTSQTLDVNKTFNFTCKDWITDSSKFALPANITFTTVTLPNTSPAAVNTTPGASPACSACDNIPAGAQKTACLTALHCK